MHALIGATRRSPSLLLIVPPPALPIGALEESLMGARYPLGSVGNGNFNKSAVNAELAPAVAESTDAARRAAAGSQRIGVLDLQRDSAFGGCLVRRPATFNLSACCALLGRDGVHTTRAGAAAIADAVRASIAPWIGAIPQVEHVQRV